MNKKGELISYANLHSKGTAGISDAGKRKYLCYGQRACLTSGHPAAAVLLLNLMPKKN